VLKLPKPSRFSYQQISSSPEEASNISLSPSPSMSALNILFGKEFGISEIICCGPNWENPA